MALLELNNVHAYYGHIHALKGISLHVEAGEIVTLLGANGAGKSTALRVMSGLIKSQAGQIHLAGEDLTALPGHEIVRRGMAMVPEGRRVFAKLTVGENLDLGAYHRQDQ